MLASPDPEWRERGAWTAARTDAPRARALLAQRLDAGAEPDPEVRESYVYALGRSGEKAHLERVARLACEDPDPFVRHAGWLAAARLDAARFRAWAPTAAAGDDAWDEIGVAFAWIEVGDLRGADRLLHWAVAGTAHQQRIASLALYRGVAPLLEAAGRWPIAYEPREGERWPAELVEEVRRRAAALDLQDLADDLRAHMERAAPIRRNVARLNGTRERIGRFIGVR